MTKEETAKIIQPHELYNVIEHNLVECYDIVGDVV